MDNFDLKKYLAEGKLNGKSNIEYVTVYHGTNPKHLDKIKTQGLISKVDNPEWYMVSTDFPSALFHSTSVDKSNVYVFEFKVPLTNEMWEGYPYFWPPYVRNSNSTWYALKQPLKSDLIEKVHEIPYKKFKNQKEIGF
tara:strand:+ start:255 stop:668 length:414 start_codon:yes stop_codon:yes gene_type:complete